MAVAYIYIHLDTISNSVMAKGLNITDFNRSNFDNPQNILLLEPNAVAGEFEPHTGLKMIRGTTDVNSFFESQGTKKDSNLKWIDFKDTHFLQQLTPMEIAELLYFGHVASQLHSPFFYKLQNNFVYFEKKDGMSKIFYRNLDNFYHLLATKLEMIVHERINEKKSFFKPAIAVAKLPPQMMKDLRTVFQEGVVLSSCYHERGSDTFEIPVYVVEDQMKNIEGRKYNKEDQIGTITYHISDSRWSVEQEEWELLPNLRQV